MRFRPHTVAMLAVATLLSIVLFSCDRPVESFETTIETGAARVPVRLAATDRVPPEAEAIVDGSAGGARFRVLSVGEPPDDAVRAGSGVATDRRIHALRVEATGDVEGGGVAIVPQGGDAFSVAFDDIVRDAVGAAAPSGRTVFRVPVTDDILTASTIEEAELDFRADPERRYRIAGLAFETETAPPEVRFAGDPEGPMFDRRLPVTITGESIIVEGVRDLIPEPGDALRISYRADPALFGSRDQRPAFLLQLHGTDDTTEEMQVYLRPGEHAVVIRPSIWGIAADRVEIGELPSGVDVLVVEGVPFPAGEFDPIPVELEELQVFPVEQWRRPEFEVFSWSLYPDILWIDSIDYATQARFFRRLAFFVEKRGFMGSLLTDDELRDRHGWNAHNYRPEGLAAFFNAVAEEAFPLTAEERMLRQIVVDRGIIHEDGNGRFTPGTGGVLAISQESSAPLRRLLTVHEAMHGVFYQEPAFREAMFTHWDEVLDEAERDFWRTFLSWATYSPEDRYLMVNEFQGYLLQQRETAIRWYFRTRVAGRLRSGAPRRAAAVDRFLADYPDSFVRAGDAVNAALFRTAGMVGGDPFCLVPIGAEG